MPPPTRWPGLGRHIGLTSYAVTQRFSQVALVRDPPTTAVIDKTGHVVGMILHQAETAGS
jgi:hypothetical protein